MRDTVGRGRHRFAVGLAAALLAGGLGSTAPAAARRPDSRAPWAATIPNAIHDRYVTTTPALGPVTVVDVGGESNDRRLLAATLQGVVNRTQARIYLRGMRSYDEDQFWLDSYTARGLITIQATVGLDAALTAFAGEVDGYVLASAAEPWTINTATTVAGVEHAVVATPGTVAAIQAAGLTEIADHVGEWADAATAYESIAASYRSQLRQPGAALMKPDQMNTRDLLVQQGMLTMYTRPALADFERVYDVIDTLPTTHPVYGYVSDTGPEEAEAVVRLSQMGRYLVPTDTTDNLSFHIAVGGSSRTAVGSSPSTGVRPCSPDEVNVVVAMSDGDNLVIPEGYYPRTDRWNSPRRGELPMGWGISPVTAILMPAVWDLYAAQAEPNDEIVDIMGLGYALPSLMPNAPTFLRDGARLRTELGLRAHWSLDALASKPDAAAWNAVDAANPPGPGLTGVLLNYEAWDGPAWIHTPAGTPVISSRQKVYGGTGADLAASVDALRSLSPSQRPLVNFFPATVWSGTYDDIADALAPLVADGVRVMTPSEAFACLPAAPVRSTTTTAPGASTTTTAPGTPPPDADGAAPVGATPSFVG